MKIIVFALVVASVCLFAGCKKKETVLGPAVPAQTWTFKSLTYNTIQCFADTNHSSPNISANNGSPSDSNNYCALSCYFYGSSLPSTSGTYTVASLNTIDTSATSKFVMLRMVFGGSLKNYMSTGGNGNQQLTVTVTNGKISITGSAIEMAHYYSNVITDSATLNFNITQTQ